MTSMMSIPTTDGRTLEKLAEADVPRAVTLLCRAFDADPLVDWLVRSDAKRAEGMRRFFGVCLRQLTMPFGEVWVTEDFNGVALWTPPNRFKAGLTEQLHFLYQAIRGMQLRHVSARIAAINEIERHHPETSHYYLFFLGIDPEHQSEGIGSRMMKAMLSRCDAQEEPAYLEATREDLVPFYERFGYRTLEPIPLPYGGPTMYPMWRKPAGQRRGE